MNRYYRGITIVLCLSIFLIYANREIEKFGDFSPPRPKPVEEKEKEKNKIVVVPVKIAIEQPKPEEQTPPPKKQEPPQKKSASEDNNDQEGNSDPAVLASYNMPVAEYLRFMVRQGAQPGLYNSSSGEFICIIDPRGRFGRDIKQNGMSSRARRITSDFPGGRVILKRAVKQFGPAKYEILLLIPENMDDRFYRNIKQIISKTGKGQKDVTLIRVTYAGSSSAIKVNVNSIEGKNGTTKVAERFYL